MKKITSSILAVALMSIFATQNTFAQYNLDSKKEVKEVKDITEIQEIEAQLGSSVVVEEKTNTKNIESSEERIYTEVEQKPQFPGGEAALVNWLKANIQYPVAQEEVAQGRVVVQFIVEKDGSIGEVKVARSCHPALDAEAVRLVKSLPKFIPGKHNGQDVRCMFALPFNFKLHPAEIENKE